MSVTQLNRSRAIQLLQGKRRITAPTAPSVLTATTNYGVSGRIDLAWTDNSNNETSFAIFRSTDNITFSEITTTAAGATTYAATSLTADTLYYFKVAARNSAGDSSYTNTASATARILPTDISGSQLWLRADNATLGALSNGANVTNWPDESGNNNHFTKTTANMPTYSTAGGPGGRPTVAFSTAWMVCTTPISSPRTVFIVYKDTSTVQYSTFFGGTAGGTSEKIFTGHIDDTQIFDVDNTASTTLNGTNRKNRLSIGTGLTTPRPDNYSMFTFVFSGVPGTRALDTIGTDTVSDIPFSGRCIAGGIAEIIVYNSALSASDYGKVENYLAGKYVFAGIAPSNLTATANLGVTGRVDLAWTDNSSDETAFVILRSTDNVTYSEIATTAPGATTYAATGLTSDTLYYFKVATRNAIGDSDPTSAASATPRTVPSSVSGLTVWLKSDAGVTLNGSRVSSWVDQSGNGNNLVQASAGSQPLYSASDAAFNGSPPSVEFVASRGDALQKLSLSLGAFVVFMVLKPTSGAGGMIWNFSNNETDFILNGTGATSYSADSAGSPGFRSGRDVVAGAGWMGTSVTTITRTRDGTHAGHLIYKNASLVPTTAFGFGGDLGTGDPGTTLQSRTLNIGGRGGFFMDMKVVEFILFDNSISAGDRTKIEAYLRARYTHY